MVFQPAMRIFMDAQTLLRIEAIPQGNILNGGSLFSQSLQCVHGARQWMMRDRNVRQAVELRVILDLRGFLQGNNACLHVGLAQACTFWS